MEEGELPPGKLGIERLRDLMQSADAGLHADDEEIVRRAREEAERPSFVSRAREVGGQVYGVVGAKSKELYNVLPQETRAKTGDLFEKTKADLLERARLWKSEAVTSISEHINGDPYKEFEAIDRKIKEAGGKLLDFGPARERLKQKHGSIPPEVENEFLRLEQEERDKIDGLKKRRSEVELRLGVFNTSKETAENTREDVAREVGARLDERLRPYDTKLDLLAVKSHELNALLENASNWRETYARMCAEGERDIQNASNPGELFGYRHNLAAARKALMEADHLYARYSREREGVGTSISKLRAQSEKWRSRRNAFSKIMQSGTETQNSETEIDLESPMTNGAEMLTMIRRVNYLIGKEPDPNKKEVLEGKKKTIFGRILSTIKGADGGSALLDKLRYEDAEVIERHGKKSLEELNVEERNENNHAVRNREDAVKIIKTRYSMSEDDAIEFYHELAIYKGPTEESQEEKIIRLTKEEMALLAQIAPLQQAVDKIRAERAAYVKSELPEGIDIKEEDGEKKEEGEKKMTPRQYADVWNIHASGKYRISKKKFVDEWSDGTSGRSIEQLEDAIRSYFKVGQMRGSRRKQSSEFTKGLEDLINEVRNYL